MGPCPSGYGPLRCPLSSSFNDWFYADPQLLLPPLGAEANTVTVSGFSGGGTTATNLNVVFSDYIKGAGLIMCGPYGADIYATYKEVNPEAEALRSIELATWMAKENEIKSLTNLEGSPVFIMSGGPNDLNYRMSYQQAQREFYDYFGANVEYVEKNVGHRPPSIFEQSEKIGPTDGTKYDMAGNILKHLLTNLPSDAIPVSEWAPGDTDWKNKGVLKKFFQTEFVDTFWFQTNGLAPYGYIYYPNRCVDAQNKCKVHMFLHGCFQTVDGNWLGLEFDQLYYGGWLEYAAANDLIILFPQARAHWLNPIECFEVSNSNQWWDQTNHLTKNGVQMQAFKKMLERVTEPRSSRYNYEAKNILALDDFNFFLFDSWRFLIAFFPSYVSSFILQIIYAIFFFADY